MNFQFIYLASLKSPINGMTIFMVTWMSLVVPRTRPSLVLTESVEMTREQIKELFLIHQLSLILKRMTPMRIF